MIDSSGTMDGNFMRKRVDVVKEIQRSLKRSQNISDGAFACIKDNLLANTFGILNRIGSGSVNGEAFKLCYPIECTNGACNCKNNPFYLAVKKIPLSAEDIDYSWKPLSKQALTSELWAELFIMRLCNVLVENKVTPNLPVYANYFVCDSCQYENAALRNKFPAGGPCVILINELANAGDIKTWSETDRDNDEWINAYFQIFSAIYSLQKYFDVSHHDLHWGNVLVHKIPPGGYWRYTIDGVDYDVPNLGWLFTLWDFGYARIPGKVEIAKWKKLKRWNEDFTVMTEYDYYESPTQNPRLLVDYVRIANVPVWRDSSGENPVPISKELRAFVNNVNVMFEHGAPVQALISTWKEIYPAMEEHLPEIIEHYSFDQKLIMDKSLYQFVKTTTRQAYMVPTRSQVEAQNRLRQELQYDVNLPGMEQMAKFMRTYRIPKPNIEFDRKKVYNRGDIIELGGNMYIANQDAPKSGEGWDYLGLEEEFDWERYAAEQVQREQAERERLEREERERLEMEERARLIELPPIVLDDSPEKQPSSLENMLFGNATMMEFDPLPPAPPPNFHPSSSLVRDIDNFLADYGDPPQFLENKHHDTMDHFLRSSVYR